MIFRTVLVPWHPRLGSSGRLIAKQWRVIMVECWWGVL